MTHSMGAKKQNPISKGLRGLGALWLIFSLAFGGVISRPAGAAQARSSSAPASAAAATNTLTLAVLSARTEPRAFGGAGVTKGDEVTAYRYIINVDNTGDTVQRPDALTGALPTACTPADPGYPDSCTWVSIAGAASSSPIFTQGDQSDFANGAGLDLPDGRYLISVLADGYKLDGAHFSVPLADPGLVTVELQPAPLPEATIRTWVFEDISPTNGAPDAPAEHGLGGFHGHILDYLGEVTTDIYGNPLCTQYEGENPDTFEIPASALDADMLPVPIDGTGGICLSKMLDTTPGGTLAAANPYIYTTDPLQVGMMAIPHLGTNRYALSAVPPDGGSWIQTTTLEGNHDWDSWVMEGATGLDTEFVVAGEPFPATFFGFVTPTPMPASGATGRIKGVIAAAKIYSPPAGGLNLPGTIWGGLSGVKIDKPIENAWLSLTDLTNGDTSIFVGTTDANGAFEIPNVPAGNYTLTYWDEPQDYILDLMNVTVADGEIVDLGVLPLTGWWTTLEGHVFNDLNRNGKRDPGEPGVPFYTLTTRKRENSLMDRGTTAVTTDQTGYYFMESLYPMTQWLVVEAYHDLYYTTGVTYQSDNQPTETTVLGAGVDVSILPIIGLSGRLDWGVHFYDAAGTYGVDPRNGGIVGTVSYDTTRNEFDPRYAAVEDWQPGIPDLTVNLYDTVPCGTSSAPCDPSNRYELAADGSYARGRLLNAYLTETWERPGKNGDGICIPRSVDGQPLAYPTDQQVTNQDSDCLEGPLMGVQFQNGYSTVDGNYGFGDGCFIGTLDASDPSAPTCTDGLGNDAFEPLPGGRDYLVQVEIPDDSLGRPLFKVTREEDINIANGDQFIPQVPPPACVGALHTVDVTDIGTDNYPAVTLPNGIIVPASSPTDNATFVDIDGTPYEGMQKPLCDVKLVQLNNGRSIVPTFNLFTDVPIPGRFWGLLVDDLNFSSNPQSLLYGEKAGIPFAPVGIYDFNNRLVATSESDFNGLFDVLLPSSNRISCPTPSGVCANLYRLVGNDPGVPGRLNPNYKPQFRTIAAEFEAFPGLIVPADLAPTQVGVTVQLPGGQINQVACMLAADSPQLFAVSQPYVQDSGSFTIDGLGFGAAQGSGQVSLDGVALPVTSWSDTHIAASVPATTPKGPHQLTIMADNGQSTVNGLTFHVLGVTPFPANTTALDNFNRADNNNLGGNWSTPTSGYRINANSLQIRSGAFNGPVKWTAATFGANQEAYFTFTDISTLASEQDLLLKISSSNNSMIEALYDRANSQVRVEILNPGPGWRVKATFNGVTFANGDQFGAQALSTGVVNVFKNGALIGSTNITTGPNPWPTALAQGGGQIGVWFIGTTNSGAGDARIDNFGGGNFTPGVNYQPNVYEVGPGRTYEPANTLPLAADHAIQQALNDAAASPGDDLVVVYPGLPTPENPRQNPRGAYYENLILSSPVKLQGVGPGGVYADGSIVPGSIIDGGAFGGDGPVAADWYTLIDGLTWDGNQAINDGAAISIFALDGAFTDSYLAAIDGFDIRGGDQQGFPGNINPIGGGPTGQPANLVTQGGAVFANAYARYLQITNNTIQNNGGAYGTVRIGTPDLPAPDTSSHNENLRLAHNRILSNGGTNLAGGVGLFAGTDNYRVHNNDLCGNFSAEYGGGLSVYGRSPNGNIHDNRIYFNASYDEGGGIMIAGELPADPASLSPGSGPVNIYNNWIQANLANDDGGGLRFLMAGGPGGIDAMNVYNNMIVNNVSTHEGGGIGLNDAPNVRFFNNTVMKNITTATAITSSGFPAPAGLSTSRNSDLLQATLPGDAPLFSNPLLFNNIFWDNRAGTRAGTTVTGIGISGDVTPIFYWDLGTADGSGLLSPTNSLLQTSLGTIADPTNLVGPVANPMVISTYDTSIALSVWRNNPNFVGALLVAVEVPPNLLGNYHLSSVSPAIDFGAASKAGVSAPPFDYDNQGRPAPGSPTFDSGADEANGVPYNFAQASATIVPRIFLPLLSNH